jgi:hypothetical protein
MLRLKIKAESLPTRCDVCHQNDMFDPQLNVCGRCTGVADILALKVRALHLRDRLINLRNAPGDSSLSNLPYSDLRIWIQLPFRILLATLVVTSFAGIGWGVFATKSFVGLVVGGIIGSGLGIIGGTGLAMIMLVVIALLKLLESALDWWQKRR